MGSSQVKSGLEEELIEETSEGIYDVLETIITCFGLSCLKQKRRVKRGPTECCTCHRYEGIPRNYQSFKNENGFINENQIGRIMPLKNDIQLKLKPTSFMENSKQYAIQLVNAKNNMAAWPNRTEQNAYVILHSYANKNSNNQWSLWQNENNDCVLGIPVCDSHGIETYYYASVVENPAVRPQLQIISGGILNNTDIESNDPRIFHHYYSDKRSATLLKNKHTELFVGIRSIMGKYILIMVEEQNAAAWKVVFSNSQTLCFKNITSY